MNNNISQVLISQLLSIPFPFASTLRKQVYAAKADLKVFETAVCIDFVPDYASPRLPSYLDGRPLSWQIVFENSCIGCDFFVKNGYIESLYVMDYGRNILKCSSLVEGTLLIDTDYNCANLERVFQNPVTIDKIRQFNNHIDIALNNCDTVVSFRECKIESISTDNLPATIQLSLMLNSNGGTLSSSDKCINFVFTIACLRYHSRL